jgi:arylformamidase
MAPMPRLHDISQRLHPALPVWPGEPPVELRRLASIGPDCPVNVGALSAPLHAGTHADAPLHYDAQGLDGSATNLEPYIGPCVLLDLSAAGPLIDVGDIDWPSIEGTERVLLRTYRHFPHKAWEPGFKAVSPAVVTRMACLGIRLLGTDAPSLDPQTSKTMDAHQAIRAADMRILEGLVLDNVPPGRYELIALPLAIVGADASPVRAVLRETR